MCAILNIVYPGFAVARKKEQRRACFNMVTYGDFAASGLDLSPLGLIQNREYPEYFCTPKGAEILGEAGDRKSVV